MVTLKKKNVVRGHEAPIQVSKKKALSHPIQYD
jgi:hypothetical protein